MIEVTDSNFNEVVMNSKKSLVVLDFWASWCMPCKAIVPILEELSEKYKESVEFVKCNVDESPFSAQKFGIRNIPTIVFLKNGIIEDRQIGVTPKGMIESKITKLIS